MADREKVVRAVETCFDSWIDRHRDKGLDLQAVEQMKRDALELLKEQEPVELINIGDDFVGNGEHVEIHDRWKCSGCGYVIYAKEKPKKVKYCLNCGKAVKWDDQ